MSSDPAKECSICQDEYNEEEKCPRALPCIHTFCTQCILELIRRNEKKCPSCREGFQGNTARDFKVNTSTLDLLRYIKQKEAQEVATVKPSSSAEGQLSTRSRMLQELKSESEEINNQNMESCRKMEQEIQATLQRNHETKLKILKSHKMVKEDLTSKLQTLETTFEERLDVLEMENEILKVHLNEIREKIRHLEDAQKNLGHARTLHAVDEVAQQVEETNTSLQEWTDEFNLFKSREDKLLREIQRNVENTEEKVNTIIGILDLVKMDEKLLTQHLESLALKKNQGRVSLEALKTMNSSTKLLLRCRKVFSIHQLGNKKICGRISIAGDKIMVHCLRDQELPANNCTVQHSDVMSLVNPSSRRAFLTFGTNTSTLGTVLIDLHPQSKRAKNFFVLCNGHKGPSYLNTVIYRVDNQGKIGERIGCGDYEFNNGTGGRELVDEADMEWGGEFMGPWITGSVHFPGIIGEHRGALFYIVTKNNPKSSLGSVFGIVKSGLDVISKAISRYSEKKVVKITECGIVLPL